MADAVDVNTAHLTVRINGDEHRLRWPRDLSLIDAMLEEGIAAPFSCKAGKCAACACQIVSGEVAMAYNEILTEEDIAEGYILGCQSRPVTSDIEVEF